MALTLMLIVAGVVARMSLTVSLTMLLNQQGLLLLLGLPAEGEHLPHQFPAPEACLHDPLQVTCIPAPFGDVARHQFRETR